MLFTYSSYDEDEEKIVSRILEMREALRHYVVSNPQRWTGLLSRITRAKALRATNGIEDINVSTEDALAAVDSTEPNEADKATWDAVRGYRDAMGFILQQVRRPTFKFSLDNILAIHYMITQHSMDSRPGRIRPGWVGIRNTGTGEYVHEGADRELLDGLLANLVDYMNAPIKQKMLQGAMTHLNLTIMHPFSDGNGRISRALQTAIIANDGVFNPTVSSIDEYIGHNQQRYYDVLSEVAKGGWNPKNDCKPWVRFCLTAHYHQVATHLRRIETINESYRRYTTLVLDKKLQTRCALALVEASMGLRIRRSSYVTSADVSENTASRDLASLADAGLLVSKGEKRGRYYVASDLVLKVRNESRPKKMLYDPFERVASFKSASSSGSAGPLFD